MIQGGKSMERLATCHQDLQQLVLAAAEDWDVIVVCGQRGEQDQEAAFKNGQSKLRYPHSRHNSSPSEAVDLAPYPLNWQDIRSFDLLGAHVLGVAEGLQLAITWGGSWKTFPDKPHFELAR